MTAVRKLSKDDAAKVLEARRRGLPFSAIAKLLTDAARSADPKARTVTEAQAVDAYAIALEAEQASRGIDEVKALDLSRLDRLIQGVWPDATSGNAAAIDRMLRIMDARNRLIGVPVSTVMVDAYNSAIDGLTLKSVDVALVAAGRRIAERIDSASGSLDPVAETKAMYLVPHLMNVLRELGATPAARAAVKTAKEEQGGKLNDLRNRRGRAKLQAVEDTAQAG